MKSIFLSLLLVFIAFGNSALAENQLRGSPAASTSDIEEERQLYNNNNNPYNQWVQYYNGNNNGNRYRNNYNAGRGYGYGGGYYGNNYSKNNNNKYYNNNDKYYEAAEDEDASNDEGNDDVSQSDDNSSFIPSDVEEKFWAWYESPPSQWSAGQWAWFSGILILTVGFMFCCCLGCANLCMEGQDRACSNDKGANFDDYTSMENSKRGSFATIQTKGSASTTGDDDDQTYDSIMRMRSDG